jgi:putative transposase
MSGSRDISSRPAPLPKANLQGVMPDHVYLLVTAQREEADLGKFVKHAKQVTGFAYRLATDASLWQPGYHERVLRDEEATLTVARYVLENPVRAGLAKALVNGRMLDRASTHGRN